jgi:hypothetical protein
LFGGLAVGMTYSPAPIGDWTKIGRMVFCQAQMTLSAKGSSTGVATIAGLPYPPRTINASFSIGFYAAMAGLVDGLGGRAIINGTAMSLSTGSATGVVAATEANFTNISTISFAFFYETDP